MAYPVHFEDLTESVGTALYLQDSNRRTDLRYRIGVLEAGEGLIASDADVRVDRDADHRKGDGQPRGVLMVVVMLTTSVGGLVGSR